MTFPSAIRIETMGKPALAVAGKFIPVITIAPSMPLVDKTGSTAAITTPFWDSSDWAWAYALDVRQKLVIKAVAATNGSSLMSLDFILWLVLLPII